MVAATMKELNVRNLTVTSAILLLAIGSLASAAQWATKDGLTVSLADGTGRVASVRVDGQELALADGAAGGLAYQEYTRSADERERTALQIGAEGDQKTWAAASYADWRAKGDFVRRVIGQTPAGKAYLQIGNGQTPGVGMAATERFKLTPGDECTISWWGRTPKVGLTYILCLRLFGKHGADVTATTPAPPGWAYSPYSKADYRSDPANSKPDAWQQFSYGYVVPEGVAAAELSLRVFRGGDLRADVDDLQVVVKPGGRWGEVTPIRAPVHQMVRSLQQQAEVAGLAFTVRYTEEEGRLRAAVEVAYSGHKSRARCLRLIYRLPLALSGWTWSADPLHNETIKPGHKYGDNVSLAGHPLSRYPLASVSHDGVGLAMATSLARPALQTFYADGKGLATAVEVALSPQAPQSHAEFSFSLYCHDPQWTFRAALERYYQLFPQVFENRSPRGGAWTLRLPPASIADPEDFRLAFYECGQLKPEARQYCRTHHILTFFYSEPWGRRQSFPQAKSRAELPPYEERLAQVQQWAREGDTGVKWLGAPRSEVARAVLNSLLIGADGRAAYQVDLYNSWAQWWQLNTDRSLAQPNIASICWQYEIQPALQWADGIYLDSDSMSLAGFEDHSPAHLAATRLPLTFSLQTATPVVLSGFADIGFMRWLRAQLHQRHKLLMLNLFAPATRLYGALGDVVGCELVGPEDDQAALQQRIFAYQRPVSNLLQWRSAVLKRVPAMTSAQLEEYFSNQLLYGFWPGISTAGGGTRPGYRYMHRYFEDAGLVERDRPLFRRYMPVFDLLNKAGWEPVTHARAVAPEVRIERFGRGRDALLTVCNTTGKTREVNLSLERAWWRQALGRPGAVTLHSVLTGKSYPATMAGDTIDCRLSLAGKHTEVLRLQPVG